MAMSAIFDWKDKTSALKCPFAAHILKMRPCADLKEDEDDEDDPSVILRRGITFGPEVDGNERKNGTSKQRGIYFLCYQSHIRDGFNLIMTHWASNHYFPEGKKITHGDGPGVDPFVSQRLRLDHPEGHISLCYEEKDKQSDKNKTYKLDLGISPWVDQRGGEYFFTPPIGALKKNGKLVEGWRETAGQQEQVRKWWCQVM